MDALVSEKGSNIIVFKPKSPRRARGGLSSLIRIFDYRCLQLGVIIGNHDGKTHPSNVPMYEIDPVEELETTCYIDQLQGNGCQTPHRSIAHQHSPI